MSTTGYGISSYILIVLLFVGYFIVKKLGDSDKAIGDNADMGATEGT